MATPVHKEITVSLELSLLHLVPSVPILTILEISLLIIVSPVLLAISVTD